MENKDPFGMQKPAQEFRTMLEIQRDRAAKAELQRDQLREALRELLNLHDAEVWVKGPWEESMEQARAALKATEEP